MEMLVASVTPGTAEALRAGHAWYAAQQQAERLAALADGPDRQAALAGETPDGTMPTASQMVRRQRLATAAHRRVAELAEHADTAIEALPNGAYDTVTATVLRDADGMAEITGRINR